MAGLTAAKEIKREKEVTAQQYAFLSGRLVKLEDAKISVMTHAFNYGTGVFEGLRGYYNPEREQLYVFRPRDHFQRMEQNCKILKIKLPASVDGLCAMTIELLRANRCREDIYIRPIAFKSARRIGVRIDSEDDFTLFAVPLHQYLAKDRPISACISSWRRVEDNAIPPRAKICGAYVNSALASAEARDNGFDEAIILNDDGHVSEAAAMNIFLVKRGRLITPPVTDNILEGITRATIIELAARELGLETEERPIDRTELYSADEIFLCGTGVEIASVGSVDRRPIGDGQIGELTRHIHKLYDDAVRGRLEKYMHWLMPVY